ncbi:Putative HTH-type transcriptional regulator, LutR-like [Desulfonema limicola]|uniref:HTH-type transcriptional regulator, LutR-like n=1 Tax=Desulfonema limicola TaxID=45656 RepID=A0A975BB06_9BACT|nr:FadR/GntR family transcriptional regulator [Desulfonema limicola]QTA82118.1 Putative HTH-type transcriptional regulator, LutR-like [Desulfonema limicola]
MKIQLKPIKPKRISDQVFDQLREIIFRGELKPGEKIMPERELSEVLGVSRTSVRDAISKLVVMGFLEQKQGQGTFVKTTENSENNPLAAAMETEDATLIDLLEVRMGMECNAAALAAQRADKKDIQFLESSLEEMKKEINEGGLGTEADVSFHMALSYATKNPLQIYLMKNFFDFLFAGINENLNHLYKEPQNIPEIIKQHTEIITAIKNKDPEKAYKSMKKHITFVMDFFKNIKGAVNIN